MAKEAEKSLIENFSAMLSDGGVFMWLIIATSVVLIATVIFKFLTLNKEGIMPNGLCKQVATFSSDPNESTATELQQSLQGNSTTLADLCKTALAKQDERREDIERSVEIKARDSVVHISSGMAIIDVIITIAPLLGLLGTASGLVSVFSNLDSSQTDNIAMAKGISEALYTTIAGLAVAVPAVIAQSHFTRRIERMSTQLELIMSKFVSSISR